MTVLGANGGLMFITIALMPLGSIPPTANASKDKNLFQLGTKLNCLEPMAGWPSKKQRCKALLVRRQLEEMRGMAK